MLIIDWLNENIVWGTPMLLLFLSTGIYASVKLKFKQFNLLQILKKTLFFKQVGKVKSNNLSPFQTLTSTLAVTLGTGNIVAIGTAIAMGGAGAIFWMWVSAFLGMSTTYLENYYGMKTRKRNTDGSYFGGAFFYIEKALNKGAAVFFAVCCLLTSLGMGNMTQMNAMATSLNSSFGTPAWVCGLVAAALIGITIFGGAKFLGELTARVIPVISIVYILGCVAVIALNFKDIPMTFQKIFEEAFNLSSIGGGLLGSAMLRGMNWGFRRGIFSNEAGLGSTVIINTMAEPVCESEEKSADIQCNWAMLCVFIDTIIMCTLTALVILLAGVHGEGAADGTGFAALAFKSAFGEHAHAFVSISVAIFAIATTSGWAVFGAASLKYLFPHSKITLYLLIYIACSFFGTLIELNTVWGIADLTNGLMAIPNLLAVLIYRKQRR